MKQVKEVFWHMKLRYLISQQDLSFKVPLVTEVMLKNVMNLEGLQKLLERGNDVGILVGQG